MNIVDEALSAYGCKGKLGRQQLKSGEGVCGIKAVLFMLLALDFALSSGLHYKNLWKQNK